MGPGACDRCLVVDEDSLTRGALVHFLEMRCRDARSVGTGELALALLQEWPVDLLITDIRLPGMDGLELATRCQNLRHRPGIILMIAKEAPPLGPRVKPLGVIGVIEKPLNLDSLATLMTGVQPHRGRAST